MNKILTVLTFLLLGMLHCKENSRVATQHTINDSRHIEFSVKDCVLSITKHTHSFEYQYAFILKNIDYFYWVDEDLYINNSAPIYDVPSETYKRMIQTIQENKECFL